MYGHVLHFTLCLTKLCGGLDLLGSMCIFAPYMCSRILQASLNVVEHSTIYWTKPRDTAGVTRHSFNDDTHCDLTAMLGCLAAMEGRLSGAIPLSLTYSNSVYFKEIMNPDALAVLRGVIGLAVHGNVWKCMDMYGNVPFGGLAFARILPFKVKFLTTRTCQPQPQQWFMSCLSKPLMLKAQRQGWQHWGHCHWQPSWARNPGHQWVGVWSDLIRPRMDHLGLSSRLRRVLFSEFRNYSEQLYFVTDFYPDRFHPVASLWFCFGKQKPQCDDWQVASLPELGPGGSWSTCWDAKSDEFLFAVFTWSSYCGLPRLVEDSFRAYSILYIGNYHSLW